MSKELPTTQEQRARILVIDDDEGDFWLIRDFIEDIPNHRFQIDWCSEYKKGAIALRDSTYDIYFIDYYLGAKTGIDLLRDALANDCRAPIILLTGRGNQKIDLEAMRLGAADYLIKSQVNSEQLERCIRYSLERSATLKISQANERKFRTIFERSKDFIFIADSNLQFKNVNTAGTELFGYDSDELLKMDLFQLLVNPAEKDRLLRKLSDESELNDYKIDLFTKDKTRKNCILSASQETDPTGKEYVQGIIHDISILQRSEEVKLQSEKLEAKGMLIRTLAHEIRNPLHNITLSLGFLKTQSSEENEEFLNVIDRNSKRINDLINELMDTNQYHKMKLEVLPLQIVMKEAIETAVDRIQLSKVKVNFTYPPEEAMTLLDKEKVKIAFLNIIVNAIEAMEEGKGELSIDITSQKNSHRIQVKDNGCGMSPEDSSRLFEPYFTTKAKGMGLGLVATHSILQSHKAEIEVSSTINQGTTFTITFPAL